MEVKIKGLSHLYMEKTPFERLALNDVSLELKSGSFTAIIGHTGSGKSTLVQHLNGLIKPTQGTLQIGSHLIEAGKKIERVKELRRDVGLVFQYPEHQLFEENVEKEIMFGPQNFGISATEAKQRAVNFIKVVGLDESYLEKSPFELSGGQMRRVAIASVLASDPKLLVLDEPTAGLDPKGQREMMEMFLRYHQDKQLTTVLITHQMLDAALFADQIVVMDQGTIVMMDEPSKVFAQRELLRSLGLDIPNTLQFLEKLETRFSEKMPSNLFRIDDLASYLSRHIGGSG